MSIWREEEEGQREVFDPSNGVGDVTEEDNAQEEGLGDGGDSFAEDGAEEIQPFRAMPVFRLLL